MQCTEVISVVGLLAILCGCDVNYATFGTSTDVGINADVKTEEVQLGYGRVETFLGPGYPDQGAVPQVVAYIGSNLQTFSPKIKQLYATGDAAGLVTQNTQPSSAAETADKMTGTRRLLVFGTGTNVGLKLGFTGNAPSSFKFGFNREEVSLIPLHPAQPSANEEDKYASVLAAIDMDQETSTLTQSGLHLTQFFATGAAARNLAKRPDIRAIFQAQAGNAVSDASTVLRTSTFAPSKSGDRMVDWMMPGGSVDVTKYNAIQDWMNKDTVDKQLNGSLPAMLIRGDGAQLEADRLRAITELNIP